MLKATRNIWLKGRFTPVGSEICVSEPEGAHLIASGLAELTREAEQSISAQPGLQKTAAVAAPQTKKSKKPVKR